MDTTLILKDELIKFGFSKKETKYTYAREKLTLNEDGSIIFWNIGTFRTYGEVTLNLSTVKKLKHRPYLDLMFGKVENSFLSFHEYLSKDSPAVLRINNLWLLVPEFQKHLDKFLPRGISNDLKYDETNGTFYHDKNIPQGEYFVVASKKHIGDIGISAKYDKELSKWDMNEVDFLF